MIQRLLGSDPLMFFLNVWYICSYLDKFVLKWCLFQLVDSSYVFCCSGSPGAGSKVTVRSSSVTSFCLFVFVACLVLPLLIHRQMFVFIEWSIPLVFFIVLAPPWQPPSIPKCPLLGSKMNLQKSRKMQTSLSKFLTPIWDQFSTPDFHDLG